MFALLLSAVLVDANYSYWLIGAGGLAAGLLVASLEDSEDCHWSATLFICALAVRMLAVTTLHYFAAREDLSGSRLVAILAR